MLDQFKNSYQKRQPNKTNHEHISLNYIRTLKIYNLKDYFVTTI